MGTLRNSSTQNSLDYVGPSLEPMFYGAEFVSGDEQAQFSAWYERVKENIFNSR